MLLIFFSMLFACQSSVSARDYHPDSLWIKKYWLIFDVYSESKRQITVEIDNLQQVHKMLHRKCQYNDSSIVKQRCIFSFSIMVVMMLFLCI